jgi:hypothetical protein
MSIFELELKALEMKEELRDTANILSCQIRSTRNENSKIVVNFDISGNFCIAYDITCTDHEFLNMLR